MNGHHFFFFYHSLPHYYWPELGNLFFKTFLFKIWARMLFIEFSQVSELVFLRLLCKTFADT